MTTRAAFLVMALVLSGCSAPGTVTPYLYDNGPDYLSEGLMRIQDSSGKIGYAVSGRLNVNRFGHLKVNIRTCKSEHFSRVRTARSVAIKGRRPSALRAFTPPLAAVEARGAGEPGPFELRLCGPFPCRKVVAA